MDFIVNRVAEELPNVTELYPKNPEYRKKEFFKNIPCLCPGFINAV
jgi:hypothetical protein